MGPFEAFLHDYAYTKAHDSTYFAVYFVVSTVTWALVLFLSDKASSVATRIIYRLHDDWGDL